VAAPSATTALPQPPAQGIGSTFDMGIASGLTIAMLAFVDRLPALGRLPERQETASQRQGCPQDRKVDDANRTGDTLALSVADRAHSHRHAMGVLCPIESCRRACSSGVECARITQRNATVATVNTTNVSSALNCVFRSGRTALQGVRVPAS
jgi:hypothetical protein